jgi:adenylate kinase
LRLVLVGPPGAGKGTQAEIIAERLGIPKISTGDIFRANVSGGTPLGLKAKEYMDAGDLVPDEVTNDMVADRLDQDDAKDGFLLDGYPRNTEQAKVLDRILDQAGVSLDLALELTASDDEVVRRLSGRRVSKSTGKVYHLEFDPPADPDSPDLYQRSDDKAETIKNRLKVYAEQTAPLIGYYEAQGKLKKIDAIGEVDEVTERALAAIGAAE